MVRIEFVSEVEKKEHLGITWSIWKNGAVFYYVRAFTYHTRKKKCLGMLLAYVRTCRFSVYTIMRSKSERG